MFIITFNPFNLEEGPPYRWGGESRQEVWGPQSAHRQLNHNSPRVHLGPECPRPYPPTPTPLGLGLGCFRWPKCSVLPLLACPRFHLLFYFSSINSNFTPPRSGVLFHDPIFIFPHLSHLPASFHFLWRFTHGWLGSYLSKTLIKFIIT